MEEYEKALSKLNNNEEFRTLLTEEEDANNCYRSDLELAEEKGIKKVVIKMFELDNMTIEQIAEITSLPIEELEKLKKEIN